MIGVSPLLILCIPFFSLLYNTNSHDVNGQPWSMCRISPSFGFSAFRTFSSAFLANSVWIYVPFILATIERSKKSKILPLYLILPFALRIQVTSIYYALFVLSCPLSPLHTTHPQIAKYMQALFILHPGISGNGCHLVLLDERLVHILFFPSQKPSNQLVQSILKGVPLCLLKYSLLYSEISNCLFLILLQLFQILVSLC